MRQYDHHLWRNPQSGIYYIDAILAYGDGTTSRKRLSLGTRDVTEACHERDVLLGVGYGARSISVFVERAKAYELLKKNPDRSMLVMRRISTSNGTDNQRLIDKFISHRIDCGTRISTCQTHRSHLSGLINYFNNADVRLISQKMANDFNDDLVTAPIFSWTLPNGMKNKSTNTKRLSSSSRRNILSNIIVFYKWLVRQQECTIDPFSDVELPKKRQEKIRPLFTHEQADLLCQTPPYKSSDPQEWSALLRCARYTGARLTEVCLLKGSDVRRFEGVWCMNLLTEKQDKSSVLINDRTIPIPSKILDEILDLHARHGTGRLFPSILEREHSTKDGRYTEVGKYESKYFIQAAKRLMPAADFHCWRVYAVSEMRNAGVPKEIAEEITGHSQRLKDSHERYVRLKRHLLLKYIDTIY